jgi:hypothetical protein
VPWSLIPDLELWRTSEAFASDLGSLFLFDVPTPALHNRIMVRYEGDYAMTIEALVTSDTLVEKLKALPPESLAEVERFIEFLEFKTQSPVGSPSQSGTKHPAFGLWADRPETQDTVAFTSTLRRHIEERRDGDGDRATD